MSKSPRFFPLYSTNFCGVLNDNLLKTLACFVAVQWVGAKYETLLVTAASGALVLPYIFLSPLAGRWAEIFNKVKVVRWAKAAEIGIVGLGGLGFVLENPVMVLLAIFLMGLQSCMFSPSKYGLIRDIGGLENVTVGTGGMEMIAFVGMLGGTLLASFTAEALPARGLAALLLGWALLGCAFSLRLKTRELPPPERSSFSLNPLRYLGQCFRTARGFKDLNAHILALSVYWLMAAVMQMMLIVYCRRDLGLSDVQTGVVMSLSAVGIGAGCVVSGILSKRRWSYGLLLPAGGSAVLLLLAIYFFRPGPVVFACLIPLMAFCLGLYKVPLDSAIPQKTPGRTLGIMLGYANQLSFIFILAASGVFAFLGPLFGNHSLFLFLALLMAATLIFLLLGTRDVSVYVLKRGLDLRYKVELHGREVMDSPGPKLLLANHQALVDPLILVSNLYPWFVRPLCTRRFFENALFRQFLSRTDAIPVPDLELTRSREAVAEVLDLPRQVLDGLAQGQSFLFYPAGALSQQAESRIKNKKMAWKICKELPEGAHVIGVRIQGLWESSTSRRATGRTPAMGTCVRKGIVRLLRGGIFWAPKRRVRLTLTDLTSQALLWAQEGKDAVNQGLDAYFNATI